jgi:hypothetical protein
MRKKSFKRQRTFELSSEAASGFKEEGSSTVGPEEDISQSEA